MPVISRLVSIPLRIAEIAFAAVVAGIMGHYLASFSDIQPWPQARWIYAVVVAGVSMFFGLIWLIPFSFGFYSWPLDVIISLAWFAAFGLLVNAINQLPCGSIWNWGFVHDSVCGRWKAAEAFSFLSGIMWLVSALIGLWFTFRSRKDVPTDTPPRRRWGARSEPGPTATGPTV